MMMLYGFLKYHNIKSPVTPFLHSAGNGVTGIWITVQTASKFEAFLRVFQRKNLSGTARGARKAYWNRRAQRYMFTPSIGREQ